MGKRYLIDSNVIIDYTSSKLPQQGSDFAEDLFNKDFLIEVLGFKDAPVKSKAMEDFLNTAQVLYLDKFVEDQTIALRKTDKKLKLGDAIIAATAIVNNLVSVTNNINDFKNISALELLNLYDITK